MTPKQVEQKQPSSWAPIKRRRVLREQKQKKVASARRTEKKVTSFAVVAEDYIKNIKRSFGMRLKRQSYAILWTVTSASDEERNRDIYPDDVVKVLNQLDDKHETVRTRSRVENIIDYAIAKGTWKKESPIQKLARESLLKFKPEINHHAALPFDELLGLISEFSDKKEGSYDALKLISLLKHEVMTPERPYGTTLICKMAWMPDSGT